MKNKQLFIFKKWFQPLSTIY